MACEQALYQPLAPEGHPTRERVTIDHLPAEILADILELSLEENDDRVERLRHLR